MKNRSLVMMLTGIVLLGACKNKSSYESAETADSARMEDKIADTTLMAKLVKTADIRFKVKNVQQTGENISALATKYNGMVMHHNMTSTDEQTHDVRLSDDSIMRISAFNTSADMTVKIPTEKLDEFLTTVSHMGIHVNESKMDIEDKSLDYLAEKLKLKNRQEFIAQQKQGKIIVKDPNKVMDLKDDMVDEQIGNKRIDDEVKYSVISMSFYQSNTISKEIIVNDDTSTYNLPFFSQLGMAIQNGWFIFSEVIIGLVNVWAFVLCGIAIWLGIRYYNKRKAHPIV
ncbi:protein of unknown function [Mucilaginibacter mallensis]|uniref:DUF4349 domain-containing protein n=1 Tax=Mucilaginibacter mallensis TaxID=652787 RepID=A0A1H1R661_MUCMA|nr:DUF4349 domain-containing protein [Mucilaginibacter mallensis]SDS31006.1 protein of unknown function [Mucilaginibacter mallensis]